MARSNQSWFFESAAERATSGYQEPVSSFASNQNAGIKTFEEKFEELQEHYKNTLGYDIRKDTNIVNDRGFMEQYKSDLCDSIFEAYRETSPNDPHVESVITNVNEFWDTKVKSYNESASISGFLPISTLEFPVLVKQFFSSILKDIIEVESVKAPLIKKHIRTTFLVDNATGDEYEYPKCMWDGTWEKIWDASKGLKIPEQVVPLTNGRLDKFDIITFAGGVPKVDKMSYNFRITGIQVGDEVCQIPGQGITIEMSTGGTLLNGDLDFTTPNGTKVTDILGGKVNFKDGTISLASTNGQVTAVVFAGNLSNEDNMRTVSVRERRSILDFKISDGPRWSMPFTIEEIEDASALLDMNYYNRMVDEVVKTQEMQECMTVIKFLNDEFAKYNGVKTDIYNLESYAQTYTVDILPPAGYAGDPFKYIASAIQFRLKSIIHQLTETTKLDGLSFVIVGNPMATQLITEFVNWKTVSGTSIGGINVNNSYGFATDLGANVRVVATNLYDAYTPAVTAETNKRELVLSILAYPTEAERISFRHLKYTSHIFTSQNQTAYQSLNAPAGAYNIVTATSRFLTMSIQGIQARLIILNSEKVYGPAPTRNAAANPPEISGAPWTTYSWPEPTPVTPGP